MPLCRTMYCKITQEQICLQHPDSGLLVGHPRHSRSLMLKSVNRRRQRHLKARPTSYMSCTAAACIATAVDCSLRYVAPHAIIASRRGAIQPSRQHCPPPPPPLSTMRLTWHCSDIKRWLVHNGYVGGYVLEKGFQEPLHRVFGRESEGSEHMSRILLNI